MEPVPPSHCVCPWMYITQGLWKCRQFIPCPEARGNMKKILLVEDDDMSRDMLSRRLERQGFNVVVGVDGVQGVALAQSELPDLILMDMSLPLQNGWEATQKIKAMDETKLIPVIALTSHAMAGDREKALAAGCDEYSTKPIDFQKLLGIIEQFL